MTSNITYCGLMTWLFESLIGKVTSSSSSSNSMGAKVPEAKIILLGFCFMIWLKQIAGRKHLSANIRDLMKFLPFFSKNRSDDVVIFLFNIRALRGLVSVRILLGEFVRNFDTLFFGLLLLLLSNVIGYLRLHAVDYLKNTGRLSSRKSWLCSR